MDQTAVNWGEALLIAGKSFGSVFLVLVILAVVTWLIGLAFQRSRRSNDGIKPATDLEETKTKD
jgi:Na+-transporting methylmalonyl-CoA/oxaloacetate decarboxylase gamma subunit